MFCLCRFVFSSVPCLPILRSLKGHRSAMSSSRRGPPVPAVIRRLSGIHGVHRHGLSVPIIPSQSRPLYEGPSLKIRIGRDLGVENGAKSEIMGAISNQGP